MAKLRIGSIEMWEVSPQSGEAAPQGIKIGHKMTKVHTGRAPYSKKVRAYISENRASYTDETLEVVAHPLFWAVIDGSQTTVSYDTTTYTIQVETNVARFAIKDVGNGRIETLGITLEAQPPYTITQGDNGLQIGTFYNGVGLEQSVKFYIKVQFPQNDGNEVLYRSFEMYTETAEGSNTWNKVGSFAINHNSIVEDAGFVIDPHPSMFPTLKKEGESLTVKITSDKAYGIDRVGGSTTWLSISASVGDVGEQNVTFAAQAQPVGSPERIAHIAFIATETGTQIGYCTITQEAGEPYAIAWEQSKLTFAYDETRIIENTLHANAAWQLEQSDD